LGLTGGTLHDKESRQQDPIKGKAIHFQNGRLNDFNLIIVDLESFDVKIEDEDKAILLVVSAPFI